VTAPDREAVVREWCAHVRSGGTTSWPAWVGAGDTDLPRGTGTSHEEHHEGRGGFAASLGKPTPGAAQTELLRLLHAGGPLRWPADEILHRAAPGRGAAHLDLPWPPAHPVAPRRELLRVATGVLADMTVQLPLPGRSRRRAPLSRWSARRVPSFVLAGLPLSVAALRSELAGAGLVEAPRAIRPRPPEIAVVVAGPVEQALFEAWAWRVRRGGARPWSRFVGTWAERDRLPRRAQVGAAVERWSAQLGADRVHVVVGGAGVGEEVARLLGRPPYRGSTEPVVLDPALVDTLRRVNTVLPFLLAPRRRAAQRRALLGVMLEDVRETTRSPVVPGLPPAARAWAEAAGWQLAERLAATGAVLHGEPGLLVGTGGGPPLREAHVLDTMLRMIHRVDAQVTFAGRVREAAPGGVRR
jgi:hypothetical protein